MKPDVYINVFLGSWARYVDYLVSGGDLLQHDHRLDHLLHIRRLRGKGASETKEYTKVFCNFFERVSVQNFLKC